MDTSLLLASGIAGFVYGISPGPAVLLVFGLTANEGRAAGAKFLSGHFFGDILWTMLAFVAILGARSVGTTVFDVLGLLCGLYLGWLGYQAITVRRRADGGLDTAVRRPLLRGLVFGISNPKGYPVAIATYTALLASYAASLSWEAVPALLATGAAGFVSAYAIIVAVSGLPVVRRFYRRHELWIVRASGVVFVGFAVHAIVQSMNGLAFRRA